MTSVLPKNQNSEQDPLHPELTNYLVVKQESEKLKTLDDKINSTATQAFNYFMNPSINNPLHKILGGSTHTRKKQVYKSSKNIKGRSRSRSKTRSKSKSKGKSS